MTSLIHYKSTVLATVAAATMMVGLSAPAQAQSETSSLLEMENIVVTARRKAESILNVPLAVSAFTGEAILDAGFFDFDDIFLQAPGVFNSNVTGRSDRVTIRGVSQVSTTGGSNAGIFVDGVFVNGPVSALELEMLERVEIIKGPQAVQFGRGTLAGAVNYVTRRPQDEFTGQINMLGATQGEFSISGWVSGPINDKLSFLVGANYYELDSLFENAFEGREDMGGRRNYSFNAGLEFEPNENITMYLRGNYYEQRDDPIGIYTQGPEFNNCNLDTPRQYFCGVIDIDYDNIRNITRAVPAPAGSDGQFQYPGRRGSQGYVGGEAGTDREYFRIALITDLNYDWGDIQLITGYQQEDERWGSDATNRAIGSSLFLPNGPAVDISREWTDFSQEVRYTKNFFDDLVTFLIGGYYFSSDRTEEATYIPEDRGELQERNLAAFASLEFAVTDWFSITGEVRTQTDKISSFDENGALVVEERFNATLPRVLLSFTPTDNMLFYASYAIGNKPGNFNTRLELLALQETNPDLFDEVVPIDEEELEVFEVGFKGTFFDSRVILTAAAYTMDWTEQQLTQQIEIPVGDGLGSFTFTDNVGETSIDGFEFEVFASVIPEIFDVRFSAAYNDATIDFFDVVGSATVEAEARGFGFPDSEDGVIVSGTPAPASPDWTFGVTGTVNYPVFDDWNAFARADYVWVDEQFASIFGQASSGTRQKLDLRVGMDNGAFRLEAFATNLTQDRSPTAVLRTIRFDGGRSGTQRAFSGVLQRPRQFGLRGTFRF
jgi:outer membrane receptor protein involved in Fe transport